MIQLLREEKVMVIHRAISGIVQVINGSHPISGLNFDLIILISFALCLGISYPIIPTLIQLDDFDLFIHR